MDNEYKICTWCKSSKPLEGFYPQKDKKSGRRSRCIECEKHLYQLNNPQTPQSDMLRLVEIFIWANSMDEERFLPIKDFENRYWISDFGRIVSCDQRRGAINFLNLTADSQGYYQVALRMKPLHKRVRPHVLVAEYFVSKMHEDQSVVNHITGCKLFNYYKDIEWATPLENIRHAIAHGLSNNKGSNHGMSKLNEQQVKEIRAIARQGLSHEQIGLMYGICRRQTGDIIRRKNWGWLKD